MCSPWDCSRMALGSARRGWLWRTRMTRSGRTSPAQVVGFGAIVAVAFAIVWGSVISVGGDGLVSFSPVVSVVYALQFTGLLLVLLAVAVVATVLRQRQRLRESRQSDATRL